MKEKDLNKFLDKKAFVNGIILDGTENMEPISGMALLVEGTRIKGIVPVEEIFFDKEYQQINLDGKYIMPGLINMHVHLAGNGKPQKKQRDNEKLVKGIMSTPVTRAVAYSMVKSYAKLELLSGVTTIRTVGGLGQFDSKCRDDINDGKIIGPRIITSDTGISVPGGHMAGSVAIAAETVEEAVQHVENNANNIDFVKLMITGGVLDAKEKGAPGELKMSSEMIRAVCDTAHAKGKIVAAHVESAEGVRIALQNGVDSIEHGARPDDEIIKLLQDNGAFVCTTISPALPYALFDEEVTGASEVERYNGNIVFEGIIECSKKALENKIPVALGNDVGCPWITQYDFWREVYFFHKYVGVSNKFALYTATLRNAILAGVGDETGSIEAGKCADLIVTIDNPLDDLRTLRQVSMVVKDGMIIDKPTFDRNEIVDKELDKFTMN